MRAVAVVSNDYLDKVNQIIDPKNIQVVAIVAEDRILAKQKVNPPEQVFAFWEFKSVVERAKPDYVFFFLPKQTNLGSFHGQLRELKFPLNKTCMLSDYAQDEAMYLMRMIRTFRKDPKKYQIIATGNSHMHNSIFPEEFELPLYNFAIESQDLYYDYHIIRRAFGIPNSAEQNQLIC